MFELESLSAVWAFEPPEDGGLVVGDHVALETVHVGEPLLAHLASLEQRRQRKLEKVGIVRCRVVGV